jgi:cysteine-rich repeat protein
VDYAITTAYYGTQKTFLSLPYGYIDLSYIGGVCSFSYNNNQDLNITLSSQLVYTSSTSLYDSAPQFQVRLRVCPNSAPYYNIADGLCYPVCPSYTYSNSSIFVCSGCPATCKTCLNYTMCTSCSAGLTVVGNACVCANYTYLYNGSCYGCHYSCATCAATGQYYNCLTCDAAAAFRSPVAVAGFNFQCSCISGYSDTGATVCSETCGDGIVFSAACDDGNTQSGDGCSSQCTVESNFTCSTVGSGPSACFYVGNVTISVSRVMKAEFENTAVIYIQVSPWIDSMSQLANSISLTSNASLTSVGYSTFQNYLVYRASYSQALRGQYVRFDLKPAASGIFSKLPPTNVTDQLFSDDGYKLQAYTDT